MHKTKRYMMFTTLLVVVLIVVSVYAPLASGCGRRDRKPPKIHWVMRHPQNPEYEDSVLVLAYITDLRSSVAKATLYCTVNGEQTVEMVMNRNGSLFYAEIPALPYNTTVVYKVCAYDRAGNKACSSECAYTVGDFHPPVITYIQQIPATPNYNDTVIVIANATEPVNASGLKKLCLTYWKDGNLTTIVMEPDGALYRAAIPAFPYGTIVQYKVSAVDYAGNIASLDVYAYQVEDQYLPVAVFHAPQNGSFASKTVDVKFYVYDDNFCEARLALDGVVLALWNQTGTHAHALDTTLLSDGVHELRLEAVDKAGNKAENTISITVDNTAPIVEILKPVDNSVVSGLVLIDACADDGNLEYTELKIDGLVQAVGAKTLVYAWNTTEFGDGEHEIALMALDKAGNKAEKQITVFVDNTAPAINSVTWTPKTPTTNETVTVSAQITEDGSGIRGVFLWFKRLGEEWQKTTMALENGNWIATIQGFEEGATVIFYVECVDNAGNIARSRENYYTVKAITAGGFAGISLYWLLLAVLAIFAILASTAYYLKRRKRTQAAATFLVSSV